MTDAALQALVEKVDRLDAFEQIRSVVGRYSRGADRGDPNEARRCLWPDARLHVAYCDGPADEFVDVLIGELVGKLLAATHHLIGNTVIELDGNRAHAESYAIAHHISHPNAESNAAMLGDENVAAGAETGKNELIIGFRYLDLFEKREGVWKILDRRLVFDWSQAGKYTGISSGGLYAGTPLRGARGASDPSYLRP